MVSVRIYELARELGVPNKEMVAKVRGLGIDVKNHMSVIEVDAAQQLKRQMEKERAENRDTKRLSSTVIRRRSRAPKKAPAAPAAEAAAAPIAAAPVAPEPPAGAPKATAAPSAPSIEEMTASGAAPEPVIDEAPAPAIDAEPAPATVEAASSEPAQAPAVSEPAEPAPVEERPATEPDDGVAAASEEPAEPSEPEAKAPEAPTRVLGQGPHQIRYAPGFEPGGKYAQRPPGRYGRAPATPGQAAAGAPGTTSPPEHLSAAEAARMMSPSKPKVVITDLDARRGRREVTRAELFKDRRFRQQRGRKKKPTTTRKGKKTEITTPAEHKRVIRLEDAIGVGEMARQMGVKSGEVLKKLWAMGLTNIMINESLDADTAGLLATEFGYEVEDVSFSEDALLHEVEDAPEDLEPRAPVITVMGHVDHGKTSLLDAIRNTEVAAGEAGGITQHMGAYRVDTDVGRFVFLDTPGHEAFTHMRARGAHCTDIVVLVVAADDGVMPQTVEAIDHAKDAEVPIIVAINKMDLPNANPDRVKKELSERELVPEEWGGNTMCIGVSARNREGIDQLLEGINLQAELLELNANPNKPAKGVVVEAKLDRARGPMSTVLIQEGTLRVGDAVVAGEFVGKVRAMLDHRGRAVKEAPPSTPVEILGLGGVPAAGDNINAVTDDKNARQLAEHRHNQTRKRELAGASASKTYEEILGQIQSGDLHELKLLVKSDVHGTSEALKEALLKLSTQKVSVNCISAGVGGIHEADVNLAKASGAIIVGFNVRPAGKASTLAEREHVEIRIYDVIYELLEDTRALMQGLLPKDRKERFTGRAEVRETFTIPKVGVIAGCSVTDGKIVRGAHLRLIRDSVKLYDSRVGTLRRFKDDVKEVEKGYECGLSVDGHNDVEVGDVIEVYEIEEVVASLT